MQGTCKGTVKSHITARIPRKKPRYKLKTTLGEHQAHLFLPSNYGNKFSSVHPTPTAEKREYLKTHSTCVPILMTVAYPMAVPMISLHRVFSLQKAEVSPAVFNTKQMKHHQQRYIQYPY